MLDCPQAPGTVPPMTGRPDTILVVDSHPESRRAWVRSLWEHRSVLSWLARADFQVRYKRASFGVLWSIAVPVLQAAVLVFVFSRFTRFDGLKGYPIFVLTGVASWSFFANYITAGSTAIVDQSGLADKVWFPRAILAMVPGLAAMVGFVVTLVIIVGASPAFDAPIGPQVVLVPLATLLLLTFSTALTLVLAALHVYFRDVRFLVQAVLLIWFWLTPIAYPQDFAEGVAPWLSANPMTGVVTLFRLGTVGVDYPWEVSIAVAVGTTIVLLALAVEIHRRHDRLFVDLL